MFALIVNYTKLPEQAEKHANTHGVWVKKYIDAGVFICAGPKPSKLGGVIIARGIEKPKLLAIIAEDPYVIEDVADYQITEFDCKLVSDGFNVLMGA